jgi:hypothetical protein
MTFLLDEDRPFFHVSSWVEDRNALVGWADVPRLARHAPFVAVMHEA